MLNQHTSRCLCRVRLLVAVAAASVALGVLVPPAGSRAAAGARFTTEDERDGAELVFSFPQDATPDRLGAILRPHVEPAVLGAEVRRVMSLVDAVDGEALEQLRRVLGENEPAFRLEVGEAQRGHRHRIQRRHVDVTFKIDADGILPMSFFTQLWNNASVRLDLDPSDAVGRYRVSFELSDEVPRELAPSCIAVASEVAAIVMGIDVHHEERQVYAIVRDEALADRTQDAESRDEASPTTGFARRIGSERVKGGRHSDVDDMIRRLGRDLDLQIIDETGLDVLIDWEIRYQADDIESVDRALREAIGLRLVPTDKVTTRLLLSAREVRPRF